MLYVTGDLHGDYDALSERQLGQLKKGDVLLVAGDFGFIWDNSDKEIKMLKKLAKKKYTILFAEGAHENFSKLREYEEVPLCSGTARRIADNIYCLNRGELYSVEGKTLFALGGGLDPHAGQDDVPDPLALPSDDELEYAVANIQEQGRKVDLILTHEAPASVKRLIDRSATVNDLNIFLDTVLHNTRYGQWFFGSLHQDRRLSEQLICVFEEVHKIP